jgi:hypothetical protein
VLTLANLASLGKASKDAQQTTEQTSPWAAGTTICGFIVHASHHPINICLGGIFSTINEVVFVSHDQRILE